MEKHRTDPQGSFNGGDGGDQVVRKAVIEATLELFHPIQDGRVWDGHDVVILVKVVRNKQDGISGCREIDKNQPGLFSSLWDERSTYLE